jgi:wyosine [tRNA(Phe)-imidazoG37] synthetase (radical SAM superfamily)
MSSYKYLFGPVPSRRFGRSLGIDLLPRKTCTYDCIFCQVGPTTTRTLSREDYAPVDEVTREVLQWVKEDGAADYLTLAGSGEPTLHRRFGEVIRFLRDNSSIPVALLTNGSLLHLPEVRAAAARASVLKTSLSAWDDDSFQYLNRPCAGITFDRVLEGQRAFRDEFEGRLWLEVFVVANVNASPSAVRKIAELAKNIRPDRIHLNTIARPPTQPFAEAVSPRKMATLASLFTPPAEIVLAREHSISEQREADAATVLDMLRRRPCTAEDVKTAFGLSAETAAAQIEELVEAGSVRAEKREGGVYYVAGNAR